MYFQSALAVACPMLMVALDRVLETPGHMLESLQGLVDRQSSGEKKGGVSSQMWRRQDGQDGDETTGHVEECKSKNMG